ncbi:MAG: gluconate 2-dehydrogenase subunit 3 family protein, partial [Bacteroidota bacterium]
RSATIFFTKMNRRDLIKYTALATGAAVSAPLASVLLSGCSPDTVESDSAYKLKFFDEKQFDLVRQLVDVILPKTDSPSASEVKVHQIMDQFLGEVHTKEEQENYKMEFETLASHLESKSFSKEDAAKQQDILQQINETEKDIQKTFLNFKQQTIAYYLTTEEIGKNYLKYLPIPGEYKACIPLEETGGKAWTL